MKKIEISTAFAITMALVFSVSVSVFLHILEKEQALSISTRAFLSEVLHEASMIEKANARLVRENVGLTERHRKLTDECSDLKEQCVEIKNIGKVREDALYTYIKKRYKRTSSVVALEIARVTALVCSELRAPFPVIVGLMEVESSFDPASVSKSGARGLMQVMPKLWVGEFDFLENGHDLHEIDKGIRAGVLIYQQFYAEEGTIHGALKRYFGADDATYKNKVYKAVSEFAFHMAERRH